MESTSGVMASRGSDRATVTAQAADAASRWNDVQPVEAMRLRLAPIPQRLAPTGASPAEISRHSMDRSFTLRELLRTAFADGKDNEMER